MASAGPGSSDGPAAIGPPASAPPPPVEASSSRASMPSHSAPTILSTLHGLMMSSSPVPAALDHPYAPSQNYGAAWKGKARANIGERAGAGTGSDEQEMLRQLKSSIEAAKSVLGKAVKDDGRTKLARAMKEVTTHQSALLLTLPSLQAPGGRPPTFSSPPRPMDLLTTISKRLGIETYLEESQFGLLKTTLAIAGKRFVLDVELEMDSAEGDDATPAPTPAPGPVSEGSRGTVRLAKLVVNHVTKDGGTANSASIATAIRYGLEAYLDLWPGRDVEQAEEVIRRIWEDMQDLASLDDLSEQTDRDWFSELQTRATALATLIENKKAFAPAVPTVLPRFKLLDTPDSPQLRLRPAGTDEAVLSPLVDSRSRCDWVVEYVPDNLPGLVVRRNWLSPPSSDTPSGQTTVPENSIRLEQLLYSSPNSSTGFPYSADFTHCTTYSSKQQGEGGLEQRWSIVHPGPAGYVVGRIGLTEATDDLERVLALLRRQALLNGMFTGIFSTGHLAPQEASGLVGDDNGDEDDDVDFDMLSQSPIAMPITASLSDNSLRAVMPLPHATETRPPLPTLTLTFTCAHPSGALETAWTMEPGGARRDQLRGKIDGAIASAREAGAGIIGTVRRIEQALQDGST